MIRRALVTGGASGIGREICRALAAADHRVAVADVNTDGARETVEIVRDGGGEADAFEMNVADGDSVRAAIDDVTAVAGPVEVLVNAAGWDRFARFVDTDEDFWDRIIEINYKGVLRTTHACVPGS